MAKKKTKKPPVVVNEDPKPVCPQGFVWSDRLGKCVANVG